jgi:hypothetical protein
VHAAWARRCASEVRGSGRVKVQGGLPSRDRPMPAHDGDMPTEQQPQVWFEIEAGSDPIAGLVHVAGEPPHAFDSWLELVAMIEQARAARTVGQSGGGA